jgi:S-DNA-T family DNA segregation ATPase FtsK/SpoIIIE
MLENRSMKLDVIALALAAVTVFLGVALWTYDRCDPPSTSVFPPSVEVHNACGTSGALFAHLLFQTLGFAAWYAELSLAVVTTLLLFRKQIDQPVLRAVGWVLSLASICTMAALVFEDATPGPVIGAGGYLGLLGKGMLTAHFATIGAFIVATSVLIAGLLLCTDYVLLRAAAGSALFASRGLSQAGKLGNAAADRVKEQRQAALAARSDDESADEDEEEWEEDEYEYEEDEEGDQEEGEGEDREIKVRTPATERVDGASDPAEGLDEPRAAAERAVKSVRNRLASALRLKKPKEPDREEIIEKLDAADADIEVNVNYEIPPIDLLLSAENVSYEEHEREVRRKAKLLEKTFANFGFRVKVVEIETGPVIAQYEVELEAGLRLSKITSLADDLAIALRVPSVRVVAPIPGKNTVGIEVPNENRQLVRLREVIEETGGRAKRMKIPVYLGKDVSGNPLVIDLSALPHLLIAGRTGTGKSVCLNSIIVSMLMERGPDEIRLLLIDPKMVELSCYKKLPHLMHPVVTDMRKAEAILAWAVDKMEERYALLARAGVRHVSVYNQLSEDELRERIQPENDEEWGLIPRQLPFIVIVADEIADLMMTAGKDVEQHIIRLAQKSRAVGIHLILATQKPTVDVITGLIKSNLPARIAFQVASRTDSRVVLDEMGAEKLLGNGDMLFLSPGTSTLIRGQGTYLSDDEITRVVDFVGTDDPQFARELVQLKTKDEEEAAAGPGPLKNRDELYEAAVDLVVREQRGSVSLLQRGLGIGYGRAARLVDYMAEDGIVGEYNGSQAREVLISIEEWEAMSGEADAIREAAAIPAAPSKRSNRIVPASDDDMEWSDEEEDEDQWDAEEATEETEETEEDESEWEDEEWEEDEEAAEDDEDGESDDAEEEDGEEEDEDDEEVAEDENDEEWDEEEEEADDQSEAPATPHVRPSPSLRKARRA